jgi:hypothetical protein
VTKKWCNDNVKKHHGYCGELNCYTKLRHVVALLLALRQTVRLCETTDAIAIPKALPKQHSSHLLSKLIRDAEVGKIITGNDSAEIELRN